MYKLSKEYFCNNEIFIFCETEESSNKLLSILHNNGIVWNNGDSLLDRNNWSNNIYYTNAIYRDRIGYCFLNSDYVTNDNIINFNDYRILRIKQLSSEFLNE
jgi:hypothetical protein